MDYHTSLKIAKNHSHSIATMLQRHAQNHTHAFISRPTQTNKIPTIMVDAQSTPRSMEKYISAI